MRQYYIIYNDKQAGPYTIEELERLALTPETMVWTEGMSDWAPAREVRELNALFIPSTPTAPSYNAPTYEAPQDHNASQYASAPQHDTASGIPPIPPSYLVWSILVTLFCCNLGGIIAIIYSSRVSSRYLAGDYERAAYASRQARNWIIASACVGLFVLICYAVWFFSYNTGHIMLTK